MNCHVVVSVFLVVIGRWVERVGEHSAVCESGYDPSP